MTTKYQQSIDRQLKNDAAYSTFFTRQLEMIDQKSYDIKKPKLEALELLNVEPVDPGAETYTYRQFDGRGVAKFVSDYSDGFPRVDVSGVEFTSKLKSVGDGWGISFQEMRASEMAQANLMNRKAAAAQRILMEKTNSVALSGDTEQGLYGLFNQPSATIVSGGTGSWGSSTAAQILADMFLLVDSIPLLTKEAENPDTLLLPYGKLRLVGSKLLGTNSDTTVLEYFRQQRPTIEVRGALNLETASAGGANRAVAYDKKSVFWIVAVPMETMPVRQQGHETVTDYHARIGGVIAPYPLSIAYLDAI